MGAFNTKATLIGTPSLIPSIAESIEKYFIAEGYKTQVDSLVSGGSELFATKGGVFKEVLGMRTALKVTLIPADNAIQFEAGIGIFGQQFVPSIITLFFAWPVLITQIWGLVQQAKLDEKALEIANTVILENKNTNGFNQSSEINYKFCTNCGSRIAVSDKFCHNCGNKI